MTTIATPTAIDSTAAATPAPLTPEIRATIIETLAGSFAGEIVWPESPDYDKTRTVWNAMVDKRPGVILKATSTADVVAAVNVAREVGLTPSIRAGGHNVAGKSMSDGEITIDMTGIREVTVDQENMLVHVGGGCQLGDVDAATGPLGLIVPAGIMSETGVPGLALGGGIGWFSRKHGLTCDQFESLEVVLAGGEVVEASDTSHPDLFWALKGGGGNFGVVTRFTFRAQRFGPMMRIGVSLYHTDKAADALKAYGEISPTLGRNVGWHAALKHDMGPLPFVPKELLGARMLMLITMYLDDAEDQEGIDLVERLTAVGEPAVKVMNVIPFGAGAQRLINEDFEDGHRYYTKEAHLPVLTEGAVEKLIEFWTEHMDMEGEVEIIQLGGAVTDLDEDATAFSHREHPLWLNFAMRWDGEENDEDYKGRTRKAVDDLKPWVGEGIYVNMLNPEEGDRLIEGFGGPVKYAKIGRIKAQYDPENLFRANWNILPVTD